MDWHDFVVQSGNGLELLEAIAKKQFQHDELLRLEAVDWVLARLAENNFAMLRSFENRSSPKTYLATVSTRLFIDFQREKFGRCVVPKSIERRGTLWSTIYRKACCHCRDDEEIIGDLSGKRTGHTPADIRNCLSTIRKHSKCCGGSGVVIPTLPTESEPSNDSHREPLAWLLHVLIQGNPDEWTEAKKHFETTWPGLADALNKCLPTSRDRLIMRRVHFEGESHKQAALAFDLNPRAVSRRCEKIRNNWRRILVQWGIEDFDNR